MRQIELGPSRKTRVGSGAPVDERVKVQDASEAEADETMEGPPIEEDPAVCKQGPSKW